MNKDQLTYLAVGLGLVAAYLYYRHNKLVKDLKAPANASSIASASADVKKDLGLS